MNESKLQTARAYQHWMTRVFLFYRIALVLLIIGVVVIPQAFAVEDMWTAANRIIRDVYSKLAAISTVFAGLMSAIAVIGAKMSGAQPKAKRHRYYLFCGGLGAADRQSGLSGNAFHASGVGIEAEEPERLFLRTAMFLFLLQGYVCQT